MHKTPFNLLSLLTVQLLPEWSSVGSGESSRNVALTYTKQLVPAELEFPSVGRGLWTS